MKVSGILHHIRVIRKEILREPLNKGRKLKYLGNYLKWNIFYKYRNRKWIIEFDNGLKSYVYPFPDHDSGEANIYLKNVDYTDIQFIRKHLQKEDTIIDAGCNVGNRTLALADLIDGALLIDAGKAAVNRAKENIALNNLDPSKFKVIHCAVGEENGTVSFTDVGGASTKNKIIDNGQSSAVVKVPVSRIDDIANEMGIKPAFIKLDVEGYDFAALKGASALLRSGCVRLVKFEHWPGQPLQPVTDFFKSLNWALFFLNADGTINEDLSMMGTDLNLFAAPVSYYQKRIKCSNPLKF
jgi:FkbM family methyltransferase